MARRWIYRPPDPAASRALAERLSMSPIAAQVLLHRGHKDPAEAARFLAPELRQLHDPFLFREMRRAAERVRAAVERREKILVSGDYDVDGTTGTAILARLLRNLGADVEAFIPERLADGYGLKPARVEAAAAAGVRLLVAVDNGTSAFAAAEAAKRAGIDLVVVDHHEPAQAEDGGGARLPEVYALLNPKVPGETYPFAGLCGCGVAFKLAWAIAQLLSPGARVAPDMRAFLLDSLSLVAIGTIADSVPLAGENRVLVSFGLRSLAASASPGLRALLKVGRVDGAPAPEDVGFRIAPRLNAAGRMGRPRLGLDLLAAEDDDSALAIARFLDEENRRRQTVERRILEEALPRAEEALAAASGRAIVLAEEGWHLGVIGIVASRLVERFNRPAVMIALAGETGRGSARSVRGVALHEAFARCKEDLIAFGGHAQAAGLEIRADRVERFRARLGEVLAGAAAPEPEGEAPLEIDAGLEIRHVSKALVHDLGRLAPHGIGNEAPLFAADGLRLAAPPRLVGRNADHLSLLVRQGDTVLKAVGFGLGKRAASLDRAQGAPLAIAFRPFISRWKGEETVELEIHDARSA
jgi:single-stranded-DNA-specific exonuclease